MTTDPMFPGDIPKRKQTKIKKNAALGLGLPYQRDWDFLSLDLAAPRLWFYLN